MKTNYWVIFTILITACVNPLFSQTPEQIREVRKLRAEASYLELKGQTVAAIEAFEKSLEIMPDEGIEAKVQELKQKLNPTAPESQSDTTEPADVTQDPAAPEPDPVPEGSKTLKDEPPAGEDDATTVEDPAPTNSSCIDKVIQIVEAYELPETQIVGKDLDDLSAHFDSILRQAGNANAAYDELLNLERNLRHNLWDDAEATLLLYQVYLENYPNAENAEDVREEMANIAAQSYAWDDVIAYQQDLLTGYEAESNEYKTFSTMLELVHYNLCKSDLNATVAIIDQMNAKDPEAYYEQTYTANFILPHLNQFEKTKTFAGSENPSAHLSKTETRQQYRKMVKWYEYLFESGDAWELEEDIHVEMQKFGKNVAHTILSNGTMGYNKSKALLFLLNHSDDAFADDAWFAYMMNDFLERYWFDTEARGIRRDLIAYYEDQSEPAKIAELKEVLLWEDIEDIGTALDEYYRAIEIAEAWQTAEATTQAKQWYEYALELDQYEEWSKTEAVKTALSEIAAQLPHEPEVELPVLSEQEQETLAQDILTKLFNTPEDQVRTFENGYLEIINRCPDVEDAEIAYWRLSNLYQLAYAQPKHEKLISLCEQFLENYPDSEMIPQMANRLALNLNEVEDWTRLIEVEATYVLTFIPESPNDEDLARYSLHAGHLLNAGRTDDALRWHKLVLVNDPNQRTFSSRIALGDLEELGYTTPESIEAIPVAVAYE